MSANEAMKGLLARKRENCKYYFQLKTLYLQKLKLLRKYLIVIILFSVFDIFLIANFEILRMILYLNGILSEIYQLCSRCCLISLYLCLNLILSGNSDGDSVDYHITHKAMKKKTRPRWFEKLMEYFENIKLKKFNLKAFGYSHNWLESECCKFESFVCNLDENILNIIKQREVKKDLLSTSNDNNKNNEEQKNNNKGISGQAGNSNLSSSVDVNEHHLNGRGINNIKVNVNLNFNLSSNSQTMMMNKNKNRHAKQNIEMKHRKNESKLDQILKHYYGSDAKALFDKLHNKTPNNEIENNANNGSNSKSKNISIDDIEKQINSSMSISNTGTSKNNNNQNKNNNNSGNSSSIVTNLTSSNQHSKSNNNTVNNVVSNISNGSNSGSSNNNNNNNNNSGNKCDKKDERDRRGKTNDCIQNSQHNITNKKANSNNNNNNNNITVKKRRVMKMILNQQVV